MTARLPPALAPWTGALTALTPGFTLALGPLLRGLDDLVSGREPRPAADGEPDGYDGLARRGLPHRLLASQWLLADELPDEFLRRAVQRELLHLSPARRETRPRGLVVVVADTGPSNAGAARLVQLAALVVLHRRAEAHGCELRLRIPGTDAEGSGALAGLLPLWLRSRAADDPAPADLVAACSGPFTESPGDVEAWILTSEPTGALLPGRRRVLTAAESAWDGSGATTVRITLAGSHRDLPLPPGPLAVSALRGRQFDAPSCSEGAFRSVEAARAQLPSFTGEAPRLLARTADPRVVASLDVGAAEPAWERHDFPAPVLAASFLGRRLVAVLADRLISVRSVGRRLRAADGVAVVRTEVGLTDALFAEAVGEPLGAVHHEGQRFLVRLAHRWWYLSREGAAETPFTTVAPGGPAGQASPITLRARSGETGNQRLVCLDHTAIDYAGGSWLLRGPQTRRIVRLPEGDRAFGLVVTPDGPALLSFSEEEHVVRSTAADGTRRDMTPWDDPDLLPAVHPTRPLIAGIRGDRLEVTDVLVGRRVLIKGVTL